MVLKTHTHVRTKANLLVLKNNFFESYQAKTSITKSLETLKEHIFD